MNIQSPNTRSHAELEAVLTQILGAGNVLSDDHSRAFYATDVFEEREPVALVIRPGGAEELGRAVAAATSAGYAVVPRGAGMSYTGGYMPTRADTVTVDMARMDKILEVNTEDMYVTVEAGCSWAKLWEALKDKGVRTTMWGTLSGLRATVGGGLSQNSMFFGAGRHGITADAVLAMQVVLADGRVVSTGSSAQINAKPFFRHYGPDLTGLFTGDTGALGIKTQATLRLVRVPKGQRFLSLAFDSYKAMFAAMSEIAREELASECFGFDPTLQRQRMKRASLTQDLNALKGVVTGSGGLLKGVKEAAKIALAGRGFMDEVLYSCHVTIEARDDAAAESALAAARVIGTREGREIENTIPKVVRGTPFVALTSMVGPEGEKWVPIHALMPHSQAVKVMDALEALWAEHKAESERVGVEVGNLVTTVANNAFLIEPVFYWPGVRNRLVEDTLGAEYIAKLKDFPDTPEADAHVALLRREVLRIFLDHGCVHFQIGKTYPYRQGLKPESYALVDGIKSLVDPSRLINPGSLGLD